MPLRILVVDDNAVNREPLDTLLGGDYDLAFAETGEECLDALPVFCPEVVLLGVALPGIDGYETCARIKGSPRGAFTQVILVSSPGAVPQRLRGYESGADAYLAQPFDHEELLATIRVQGRLNGMLGELWRANQRILQFNSDLEQEIQQRTTEVTATRDIAVFALAKLTESRDPETGEHLDRMRTYSRILAEQLGCDGAYSDQVDAEFIDRLYRAAPLHDIGKVGVPDAILLKPGPLTPAEFTAMQRHAVIGAEALRLAAAQSSCGDFLNMACDVARHHHERFDGRGYPDGLAGHAIPLAARIVALADVFDALTSPRVYKPAFSPDFARDLIERESGKHFDPVVVAAFQARYADFLGTLATRQAVEAAAV